MEVQGAPYPDSAWREVNCQSMVAWRSLRPVTRARARCGGNTSCARTAVAAMDIHVQPFTIALGQRNDHYATPLLNFSLD